MEDTPVLKAKQLSYYISNKYGEQALGVFRLLSSVAYFRGFASTGRVGELLGMNLVSFEKYLKEQHHVFYRRDGRTFGLHYQQHGTTERPRPIRTWDDDHFLSISGAVVHKVRALYPDAASLVSSPMVVMGCGANVDDMLAAVNCHLLEQYAGALKAAHPSALSDADYATINNYTSLVSTDDEVPPLDRYKVVDAIHRLLVEQRLRPLIVTVEAELPPATQDEIVQVISGDLGRSVVPIEGKRLPDQVCDALRSLYPRGNVRDGAFYLMDDIELDPFKIIGSERVDIELPVLGPPQQVEPQPPLAGAAVDPAALAQAMAAVLPTRAEAVPGGPATEPTNDPTNTNAAVDHVIEYCQQDLNKLSAAQREVALFGYRGGAAVYEKIGPAGRTAIKAAVPLNDEEKPYYNDYEAIGLVARIISQRIGSACRLTPVQCDLLAAGRFVAWKGNWQFDPVKWVRIR